MLRKQPFLFIFLIFLSSNLLSLQIKAQDTLPNFNVQYINNQIIIFWVNQNTKVNQINIQRSSDPLTGFKTIAAIEEPKMNLFEFVDTKAINEFQYYRLYITEEGGNYLFTNSKKPVFVIEPKNKKNYVQNLAAPLKIQTNPIQPILEKNKFDTIVKKNPEVKISIDEKIEKNNSYTISNNDNRVLKFTTIQETIPKTKLKLSNKQDSSYPHFYSFINQQGQFELIQANVKNKHINVVFYKDDGTKLFVLNDVKENQFILDKTNFLQSGWFYFEWFENDKLISKQKFYLPK